MEHEITYSPEHDCYVWWYAGVGKSLDAATHDAANEEVEDLIAQGIRPDMDEFRLSETFADDEDGLPFDDFSDDDSDDDSAFAAAGFGITETFGGGYTADELGFDIN